MPELKKAKAVVGHRLVFRNVDYDDTNFIYELRRNPERSYFMNDISQNISDQVNYIKMYQSRVDAAYFTIRSVDDDRIGTVRLYDTCNESFSWGSWVLIARAQKFAAIESVLMVYAYATDLLGFSKSHFRVRKGNQNVIKFHERFGAIKVGETIDDFLYEITKQKISESYLRYQRYLPKKIKVFWL